MTGLSIMCHSVTGRFAVVKPTADQTAPFLLAECLGYPDLGGNIRIQWWSPAKRSTLPWGMGKFDRDQLPGKSFMHLKSFYCLTYFLLRSWSQPEESEELRGNNKPT